MDHQPVALGAHHVRQGVRFPSSEQVVLVNAEGIRCRGMLCDESFQGAACRIEGLVRPLPTGSAVTVEFRGEPMNATIGYCRREDDNTHVVGLKWPEWQAAANR